LHRRLETIQQTDDNDDQLVLPTRRNASSQARRRLTKTDE
jgi:hypothetical protein